MEAVKTAEDYVEDCLVFAAVTELTIDITNCMKTAEDCVLC